MFRKILCVIIALVCMCTLNVVSATSGNHYTSDKYQEMTDYEFYTAFAKALKEHDSKTLAEIIPHVGDESQFDHLKNVTIKSYSVKANKDSEYMMRGPAIITFNITKSSDNLFPVGKHKYYVCYQTGMYEWFDFYQYDKSDAILSEKYDKLAYGFSVLSYNLNYFESYTEKQLKNYDYSYYLVHGAYHYLFQDPNDFNGDGISVNELNKKLQTLFGSKKKLSGDTLETLTSHFYEDGKCFYRCNHGGSMFTHDVKKITKNKKTGLYTMEIWYYSDAAKLNPCRKIKYTYKENNGEYTLKKINCYYNSGYDVFTG